MVTSMQNQDKVEGMIEAVSRFSTHWKKTSESNSEVNAELDYHYHYPHN